MIDQVIQKDYKNLQGRSAILECVVRDSEGKKFDLEIQRGELKKAKETALSLAEMGLPIEKIAKAINININDVQKWIEKP